MSLSNQEKTRLWDKLDNLSKDVSIIQTYQKSCPAKKAYESRSSTLSNIFQFAALIISTVALLFSVFFGYKMMKRTETSITISKPVVNQANTNMKTNYNKN